MALSRTKTWIAGEVLTASDLNTEFNNILNNALSLISPLTGALDVDGNTLTLDAAGATQVVSSAGVSWNFTSGAKTGTPATTGSVANWSAQTFTDSNTAGSGTAAAFVAHAFKKPTLAATNSSVTTTDAATVYIEGAPAAGTNETLTNPLALWIDDGASRFDGVVNLFKGADIASAGTLNLTTATGNLVHVTGTTTITAVTLGSGMMRQVIFDGALTLTHHATNNNLPGAANITTAAGDRAMYWADGTTVYCVSYQPAAGNANAGANTNITSLGGISNAALGDMMIAQTSGVYRRAGLQTGWHNGTLAAAVAGNAMTINLLDANGATPSTANPVFITFRNVSAASGSSSVLMVTAATSLVISSGSTLGTTSAFANRIWIVGFNDGGTFRLGAINCLVLPGSGVNQIYPLKNGIASSTAEGGAGAADTAGVFYTGTAVTSKAFTIIGYVESTQATAGTWVTSPSKVQAYGEGVPLPGTVVQKTIKNYTAFATGTTAMFRDNTAPLITEGDQYMSQSFTLTDSCNYTMCTVAANVANSNANIHIIGSVFYDSTLQNVAEAYTDASAGGIGRHLYMQRGTLVNTSSAVTWTFRAGGTTGATTTFNGTSGGDLYANNMASMIQLEEIMV